MSLRLLGAFDRGATAGTLRAHVADSILDVNDGHRGRIGPPELADDEVSGQPGMRLLQFIGQQEFCPVHCETFQHYGLVCWRSGDPGSAGGILVVEHELAAGEAETLGSAERAHDHEKLFIEHSLRLCGAGAEVVSIGAAASDSGAILSKSLLWAASRPTGNNERVRISTPAAVKYRFIHSCRVRRCSRETGSRGLRRGKVIRRDLTGANPVPVRRGSFSMNWPVSRLCGSGFTSRRAGFSSKVSLMFPTMLSAFLMFNRLMLNRLLNRPNGIGVALPRLRCLPIRIGGPKI